jgi:hypothetical protein
VLAAVAPEPRKAACQDPAGEKLAELPFDEQRQPLPVASLPSLGKEGLKVRSDHPV